MLTSLVRLLRIPQKANSRRARYATRQDIEACFRLLLGREANAEERLRTYVYRRGKPLGRVVAGYLNSLEFSQRRLLIAGCGNSHAVSNSTAIHMYREPRTMPRSAATS